MCVCVGGGGEKGGTLTKIEYSKSQLYSTGEKGQTESADYPFIVMIWVRVACGSDGCCEE